MNRARRWSVISSVAVLLAVVARGQGFQNAIAAEKPAEEKWFLDRAIRISPAAAPIPALKYRLFPLSNVRKDGNAVPIYLRLNHEQNDAARANWREEPEKWNQLPLHEIPLKEANEFI